MFNWFKGLSIVPKVVASIITFFIISFTVIVLAVIILVISESDEDKAERNERIEEREKEAEEKAEQEKKEAEETKDDNPIDDNYDIDKNKNDIEAEKNAKKHPAKRAVILATKGDYNFTGMKYFFKGQFVRYENSKNIFDELEEVLLIRNEYGYVMPIFPPYNIDLQEGDVVSVWGTLTGDGYVIDNVVGQTGAIIAYRITVNGEMQY